MHPSASSIPPNMASLTKGSHTGNDSINTAVPHGLGKKPEWVSLMRNDGAIMVINGSLAKISYIGGTAVYAVTIPDDVNFYVGNGTSFANSGNGTGNTYEWVATA